MSAYTDGYATVHIRGVSASPTLVFLS
jgi:hypothetical protein